MNDKRLARMMNLKNKVDAYLKGQINYQEVREAMATLEKGINV